MLKKKIESVSSRVALVAVAVLFAAGTAAAQDEDPYDADEDPFADEDDPFVEGDDAFANESSEDPFTEYEESASGAQRELDAKTDSVATDAPADDGASKAEAPSGDGAKIPVPGALFAIGALGAAVAILGRKRA